MGMKIFARTKQCAFPFLVLVYAVLHSEPFLPEVTKMKKTEINSHMYWDSLSPQGAREIKGVELNAK